jgi:hypothetical protein
VISSGTTFALDLAHGRLPAFFGEQNEADAQSPAANVNRCPVTEVGSRPILYRPKCPTRIEDE